MCYFSEKMKDVVLTTRLKISLLDINERNILMLIKNDKEAFTNKFICDLILNPEIPKSKASDNMIKAISLYLSLKQDGYI